MKSKLKVVAIISFILVAIALLLVWNTPATGYELSIYESTPLMVWIFLILSIFGGLIIIIHQVATRGYEKSRFWLTGLSILILTRAAFLSISYIRGYIAFKGDYITHLGMVKDIISTGHFGSNYYPITHILVTQVSSCTGISEVAVLNIGSAVFSSLFFLFSYLLAKSVLPEKGQQLVTITVVTLLFAAVDSTTGARSILVLPNSWSLIYFPLFFFCYFRFSVPAYRVLFVILSVLYPFFHPLSALIIIVALVVIEIAKLTLVIITRRKNTESYSQYTFVPLFIEVIILCMWVLSCRVFYPNIRLLWHQIIEFTTPDVFGGIGNRLEKVDMVGLDLVVLYIKMYGTQTILIILSLVAVFFLLKQIRTKSWRENTKFFYLSATFMFFGFLYFLYLLGMPGLSALGGTRILSYVLIFTPVIASFGIYKIFRRYNFQRLVVGGFTMITAFGAVLAILQVYPSPYILKTNSQITQSEMVGMEYFLEYKSQPISTFITLSSPARLAQGILGTLRANERPDIKRTLDNIPDHFNYQFAGTFGETQEEDKYLPITKMDRITYLTVWKVIGRFTEEDFIMLDTDLTVDKLYANGEFDVYYVHSVIPSS
jgi:hypothetical protein